LSEKIDLPAPVLIIDPDKPLPLLSRISAQRYDFIPEIDHLGLIRKMYYIDAGTVTTGTDL
jgi:hypothetical protein